MDKGSFVFWCAVFLQEQEDGTAMLVHNDGESVYFIKRQAKKKPEKILNPKKTANVPPNDIKTDSILR